MKKMLINATQSEEIRVALVDGQQLYNLDIETPQLQKKKSNIYKGTITRIEPSLEAAFIDYGSDRHGFLPFKEIAENLYPNNNIDDTLSIKDILKEGQEIIVQIQKEERGNKGAALTTQISLAGPYIVIMPNNSNVGGISRRIEGEHRTEVRDSIANIDIPKEMGLIIRTAGVGKTPEELQWSVQYLVGLWKEIKEASTKQAAPFLIYKESDIVILAVRDYLQQDISEIIVDNMDVFYKIRDFIKHVMPQHSNKVKPYQDERVPLFTRYQIESQIETVYQRNVVLASGGSIVIDTTEALTAIDINSSRSTKGADIEDTAFHTNMEAANEITRQLRLRDLGGLVVIDFIDMHSNKHQREIENVLREAVRTDRARIQVGKISRFGLLEMSRQRLRPSIEESSQIICSRCQGTGVIRGVESLGLSMLRLIEEEVLKENIKKIMVQVPVDVATFLLNEKRQQLIQLEKNNKPDIIIIPNEHLKAPQYLISRTRLNEEDTENVSYKEKTVSNSKILDEILSEDFKKLQKEKPAIKSLVQKKMPAYKNKLNFIKSIWKFITGNKKPKPVKKPPHKVKGTNNRRNNQRNKNNRNRDNSNQNNAKPRNNEDSVKNKNEQKKNSVTTAKKPVKEVKKSNFNSADTATSNKVTDIDKSTKEPSSSEPTKARRRNNTKTYNRRRIPVNASTISANTNEQDSNIDAG